jgi:excinuclease ABC subunit B
VSCIYGLGSPDEWRERVLILEVGEEHDRDAVLTKLIESQYVRNDTVLGRGRFRVKGDVVEVQPANIETAYRVSFFGDEVEQITHFDPLTGEVYSRLDNLVIWPATEYVTSKPTIERAVDELRAELEEQVAKFEAEGRMLEAHRIRQRTEYDLEMMRELGFCSGIENYSRVLEGRPPGSHPFTLIDYFPDDFVVFVDESHQTVPQLGGMYEGDRSRKQTLVDYGFRLPSALDNRPLRFDEFLGKVPQLVFVSATPGAFELSRSKVIAEQLIRPTGIVDPEVELRPTRNQIDDLLNEIRRREEVGERTLVTTLTKKMAEDLTDYLLEAGVRARYLHSEIDTLERIAIIRELRLGEYDVLVGVNLLREGLDLPEVSLVAVLDADKEGFLRGKTALIQTTGRAARNTAGKVLLYADKRTEAIVGALEETNRRRAYQVAYNEEHGITPETIVKGVSDISELLSLESPHVPSSRRRRGKAEVEGMSRDELEKLVITLEEEMYLAAEELRFEYAAKLRDEIKELRRELNAFAETAS